MGSFQQRYQTIKTDYDRVSNFDMDGLSLKIQAYVNDPSTNNQNALATAAQGLTDYSANLTRISGDLRQLLKDSGQTIQTDFGSAMSEAEERYEARQHPERFIQSREVAGSFLPTLRLTTIPALVAVATFMAAMTIFLIFQLLGFRGSISLPPALMSAAAGTPGQISIPFYKNPLVLAGALMVVTLAAVTFSVLYYEKWKKEQPR
jgi:hypothetical protein